ncbi:hypothetical protein EUTSA_v10017824mg [Eutrema salsugineum]|uniref:RING-type E3 ubiquitin transferase n=1 Tax=Eutrema salsugineum TaxID=72664 RepID=V4NWM6_EUTSA|nr:RING-H2 finger protein ATL57 [Eutrema salsugineum]ESQ51261.1 hypothetical protein EUTSA_v10017824mg [Eutrema salsugineum]
MESKKHMRKLLPLNQARVGDRTTLQNATSASPSSSSSTSSSSPSSSLDSSVALTLFVLLIALFFMAFFSVFIRHFADDDNDDDDNDDDDPTADNISSSIHRRRLSPPRGRRGLDSQAVRSLPVYRYTTEAKQRIEDCVICLSDFEEGETVKVLPHCGHVFHVDCVDTWLSSHVSCPFCRSSQVLPDQGSVGSSCRSTVGDHDTCDGGVGPCMRRCSSCSSLGQRTGLDRSLSL